MAKLSKIKYNPRHWSNKAEIINVSASVGANGVNTTEDVIVVQALLKYALGNVPGLKNINFPEPSGAFIKNTAQHIKLFQKYNNTMSNKRVITDGRIDPARRSAFSNGKMDYMTIYALNVAAQEWSWLYESKSHIEAVCKRWPFIEGILYRNGVGTLGLELE